MDNFRDNNWYIFYIFYYKMEQIDKCEIKFVNNVEIYQQSLEATVDYCIELCEELKCDGFQYDFTKQPNCILYKITNFVKNRKLLYTYN